MTDALSRRCHNESVKSKEYIIEAEDDKPDAWEKRHPEAEVNRYEAYTLQSP